MADDLFSRNFFEIFQVPAGFVVDFDKVDPLYRELQKSYHPDRFVSSTDQERRLAIQNASLINQAYQTLKEPVPRAQYLLKLKGMDIDAETDTTMDAEFLMQQMEFREAIAEVRSNADPLDELDTMLSVLKNDLQILADKFNTLYTESALADAREVVRKMQFLIKARKEIDTLSEELENELL
ncbi:MAG: Fe-S protein assembly co-chaperone HscB [Gammaproteobacteria bacterium]|nr:Fe-S protein assembly co-chaperone HscB [Gammaproteobacteria bacterium]